MEPMIAGKPLLRGWSHALAFAATAVLVAIIVVSADGAGARSATTIYAVGITGMLGVSAMYHRVRWGDRAHGVMARLDHSAIFVAIAATYTPVAALTLDGWRRVAVLAVAWSGAAIGSGLVWAPLRVPRVLHTSLYAIVGWSALLALPQLFTGLGTTGFLLVLGGGVAYTIGAAVYALRRPDPWPRVFGFHEIFHACTIAAFVAHYIAISIAVYGAD
jgi:hemolysin III